ncbi:hypothetical protein PO909_027003 [Leuciscus waleckii]
MLKSFNIMKIVQLHLYLLIWCEAAETLTDQLTDLGQNVTINCDFDVKEVNWLLLKLPDSPVWILRTFSSTTPHYYNNRFRQKYSVQRKPHLFINNVTIDDLGDYYCVTTDAPPKYSDGTRLHITEPTAKIQNHTMEKCIEQNQTQWHIIIIICALLITFLIIVIIGLLKVFVLGRKRTRDQHFQNTNLQQPQVMGLQQPQDQGESQYAMAVFPTPCKRFQPRQINSTYALLQLPESSTHHQI